MAGAIIGGVIGGLLAWIFGGSAKAGGQGAETIEPKKISVVTNIDGKLIDDCLGTVKLNGNIIWYGGERNEEVIQKQKSGGKGGGSSSTSTVVGHRYYLSWAVGLCAGPVDEIYTIYRNDTIIWNGNLTCPESGGVDTISITGFGTIYIYFGTDDQEANSKLGSLLSDDTYNPKNRHVAWAYFDDCFIGDFNRAPTMRFVIRKTPEFTELTLNNRIQIYDYNPSLAVYYILKSLIGLNESWFNEISFSLTANILYTENRGISIHFDKSQEAMKYLEQIITHINGKLYYGVDAEWHLDLLRNNYTEDLLPVIDESIILDTPTIVRKSWLDTVNEVRVEYSEMVDRIPFKVSNLELMRAISVEITSLYGIAFYNQTDFVVGNRGYGDRYHEYTLKKGLISDTLSLKTKYTFSQDFPVGDVKFGLNHIVSQACKVAYFYPGGAIPVVSQFHSEVDFNAHCADSKTAFNKSYHNCSYEDYVATFHLISTVDGPIYEEDVSDRWTGVLLNWDLDSVYNVSEEKEYICAVSRRMEGYGTGEGGIYVRNSLSPYTLDFAQTVGSGNENFCCKFSDDGKYIAHGCSGNPGKFSLAMYKWENEELTFLEGIEIKYLANIVRVEGIAWFDNDTKLVVVGAKHIAIINFEKEKMLLFDIVCDVVNLKYAQNVVISPDGSRAIVSNPLGVSSSSGILSSWKLGDDFLVDGIDFRQSVSNPVSVDIANKDIQGKLVSKTIKMGYYTTNENAVWAAEEYLKNLSYPAATINFIANRNVFKLEPGDVFKFSFSEYNISEAIYRITRIEEENLESENIKITATEEVTALTTEVTDLSSYTDYSVRKPTYETEPFDHVKTIESPYVFNPDDIKFIPLVAKQLGDDTGFEIYLSIDEGTTYNKIGSSSNFAVHGLLVNEYSKTFAIDDNIGFEIDISNYDECPKEIDKIQTITRAEAIAGYNIALLGDEIISIQSVIPVADNRYKMIGIIRGRWDTFPKAVHPAGTNFYFLGSDVISFEDSNCFKGITRHFKYVPYNLKKVGDLSDATISTLNFIGRYKCPLLPLNFKANGKSRQVFYTGDIVLTWWPRYKGIGTGHGNPNAVTDVVPTQYEGYFKIEVTVSSVIVRTVESIDALAWTYTSAMNVSDNGFLASEIEFSLTNYIVGDDSLVYSSDPVILIVRNESVATTTTT